MRAGNRSLTGRSACCALAIALAPATGLPVPADAHEIIPGVTGFPSLLLHPFAAVETVLLMIGLALVVGAAESWRGTVSGLMALAAGATAGVMLQPVSILVPDLWRMPLVLAFILGVAAASGRALPPLARTVLILLVSLALGTAVPPESSSFDRRAEAAAAAVLAILLGMLVIAVPRAAFGRLYPVRLAGQVLGAWIIAISLLGMAVWFR